RGPTATRVDEPPVDVLEADVRLLVLLVGLSARCTPGVEQVSSVELTSTLFLGPLQHPHDGGPVRSFWPGHLIDPVELHQFPGSVRDADLMLEPERALELRLERQVRKRLILWGVWGPGER